MWTVTQKIRFPQKNTASIAAKPHNNIDRSVTQHCVIFQTWDAIAALF